MAPGSEGLNQTFASRAELKQIFSIFSVYIVNSQLSILNLGDNNITDEDVKQLSNVQVSNKRNSNQYFISSKKKDNSEPCMWHLLSRQVCNTAKTHR